MCTILKEVNNFLCYIALRDKGANIGVWGDTQSGQARGEPIFFISCNYLLKEKIVYKP
jgi:hypothetical protein